MSKRSREAAESAGARVCEWTRVERGRIISITASKKKERCSTVELRTAVSPRDVKHYTTERLREEFLIQNLFVPGEIKLVYSHIDRIITGAAVPVKPIVLTAAGCRSSAWMRWKPTKQEWFFRGRRAPIHRLRC